jgi:flagellar protein FlaJ
LIEKLFYPILKGEFEGLRPNLRKAKLYMTLEEYISAAFLTALIFFLAAEVIFFLVFMAVYGLPLLVSVFISLLLSLFISFGIGLVFFIYPPYHVDSLKRDIELNIPYATTHMATIAGTGVPIYTVFKLVSEFKEYGELALEFGTISRDIEIFGTDAITAISQSAIDTPSPHLKELLWGLIAIIRSGGDLRRYLVEKASAFMDAQKNLERQYLDSLSLLAEMYTTIFVAGPILFVVMITVMGSMGNLGIPTNLIMNLVIYILMPIASIGFIILIEGSKPTGG